MIVYVNSIWSGAANGMARIASKQGIILSHVGNNINDYFTDHGWSVILHEFGHQAGLYHTHEAVHGTTPCSNKDCETTGDLICDTPPDPYGQGAGCNYVPAGSCSVVCKNGCKPDANNIMSYFWPGCKNKFSVRQYAVMACILKNLLD